MTATTARPALDALADEGRLHTYREAALVPDPALDDVINYLRVLGNATTDALVPDYVTTTDDPRRYVVALGALQGTLQALASGLLNQFTAEVRAAPASGLAELVREVAAGCGRPDGSCPERVLPWQFDGQHCSPECRNAAMFADGEDSRG